jgi:hypothetical protein
MEIRVECHAGYRGDQEPRAFWLGERRLEAVELADRWLSSEHRYYKIRADDGDFYILRYDEIRSVWELSAFTRSQAPAGIGEIAERPPSSPADDV